MRGEEVFVGVNSTIEWLPEAIAPYVLPETLNHLQADHVVQVIGVETDPHTSQPTHVILNDPTSPEGRGVEIPVEQFQAAMETSHNYMASTEMEGQNSWFTSHLDNHESMYFGCKITTGIYHSTWLDGQTVGTYNGNSFYWNNNNLAGH